MALGLCALSFALTAGCAEVKPPPIGAQNENDAATGGSGGGNVMADDPAGAGSIGSGGMGITTGGAPSVSELPQCTTAEVPFGACVELTGELADDLAAGPVFMTGVVEAIERPRYTRCLGRENGNLHDGAGDFYDVVINDGETTARISVGLPWNKPILNVGDVVTLEHRDVRPMWALATSSLTLRNEAGQLLLAVAQSGYGFGELIVRDVAITDGSHTCSFGNSHSCGSGTRGSIRVQAGADDVTVGYSMRAEVGDYVVLNLDNTRFEVTPGLCTDIGDSHRVAVAVVRGNEALLAAPVEAGDEDAGL